MGISFSQELRDFRPEPAVPDAVMNRAMREVKAARAPLAAPSPAASSLSPSTALVLYEPNKFLHRVIGVPSR